MASVEGVRPVLAPQRLAHIRVRAIRVDHAIESLFGAVVNAGDALQAEQATQAQGNLRVVAVRVVGITVVKALALVVVIQESDKESPGLAVRGDHIGLNLLAVLVHTRYARRCRLALGDRWQD